MSISDKKNLIENKLNKLIPSKNNDLYKSISYSISSNGKRLRPLIVLITHELFDNDINKALIPACAIELIHSYSLIHDDLPSMDNDDYRRGKLTTHKMFSESTAILAGDAILTYAFKIISDDNLLSDKQKIKIISILANLSGINGMVLGQLFDIENSSNIKLIHRKKTAYLFAAAFAIGGITSNQNDKTIKTLLKIGIKFGEMFQIYDDIKDFGENNTNYANMVGLKKAKTKMLNKKEELIKKFKEISNSTDQLEILLKTIFKEI